MTAESRVGTMSQGFWEKTHLELHVEAQRGTRQEPGLHFRCKCV